MMGARPARAPWVLLVAPVAAFAWGMLLAKANGPYHFGDNLDPAYPYLLNSLNLLTLHTPGHSDHPGTTLQLLGAIVVVCRWLATAVFGGWHPLQEAVLSHPEDYLHSINLVLNLLIAGTLWFAAQQLHHVSNSVSAALVLQATFFCFLQTFLAHSLVWPESLLIATAFALIVPIIRMALSNPDGQEASRYATTAGLIFGFGLVTKVTFFPWASVILLFPGTARKARFLAASVAACVVLLIPIWPRLPQMAKWMQSLAMHSGQYGGGSVGLPSGATLLANLRGQLRGEPILFLFLLVYAGLLFLLLFRPNLWVEAANLKPMLWTGCITIAIQTAMSAKHPAPHYIVPALLAPCVVNGVITATILRAASQRWRNAIHLVLVAIFAGILYYNAPRVSAAIRSAERYRDEAQALAKTPEALRGCRFVGMYRSSLPTYALSFGNEFANFRQGPVLQQLYPDSVNYNIFAHKFYSITGEQQGSSIRHLVAEGNCVIMQGTPLTRDEISLLKGLSLQEVALSAKEASYRVSLGPDVGEPLLKEVTLPPTAIVIEAERFASGTVVADTSFYGLGIGVITSPKFPAYVEYGVSVPADGRYAVLVRYASADFRPMRMFVSNSLVTSSACSEPTGGYAPQDQQWQKAGVFPFARGSNTLRLDRNGPFPHIDKIALVPVNTEN